MDGTIRMLATVATNPTNLLFQVTGNTLDVSWPADHTGWRLQSQTNPPSIGLTTNWFTVPGSTTTNHVPFLIDRANGSLFLRLVYP